MGMIAMCYSPGVSLFSSVIMMGSCAYAGVRLGSRRKLAPDEQAPLISCSRSVIVGYFCIGLHQLFELLSVSGESQLAYKTGLVASILSMYFFMRSLEELTRRRFGSSAF